jgi:carbon storage regulator
MLVLTRKLMERLFIGDDICVTVVRLEAGQVRLGIEAPRDVAVVRAELVSDRGATAAEPGHVNRPSSDRGELRHSPFAARGTGSRHRGRSR